MTITPPQPERPLWDIPAELLREPAKSSATELQSRLACPLQWTLERVAHVRPSHEATLPDMGRLQGNFCHQVLERALGEPGAPPPADEAVNRVAQVFDERLPLDAAPLAQPAHLHARRHLRENLLNATRALVEALHAGEYRIVGIEQDLHADIEGRPLEGSIDAVVENDRGEGVVDFKFRGHRKYPGLLEDGRAVQLAVYAHGRAQETGAEDALDAAGYLVITARQVYTPEGSPLDGVDPRDHVRDAPGIPETWTRFLDALHRSQDWLTGEAPVPARPLQDEDDWPRGADLVIDTDESGLDREPCRYCDHSILCGLRRCE